MKEQNKENNTVDIITDETTESERSKKIMNKDKNNKLSHLPFEEYFESDWRKHFQEEETVQSILDAAGLSDSHDFVQVNSRYLINDNRVAVIALVRRKNSKLLEKLIIDVIAGWPSFEQLRDVVYNIGSDCDYHAILYDQNSKNEHIGMYLTNPLVHSLVRHLDGSLFLYWINVDAYRDVDGALKVNYTIMESAQKSLPPLDRPDRLDFEYAELGCFVLGYYCLSYGYGDNLKLDSYYVDEDAETRWTDEGIITEVSMDQDDYTWLFTKRTENIKDDDYSYVYDEEKGILTITDDLPFQNFKNSLPKAKSNLVDSYYTLARIGSWIDELLREKEEEEEDEPPSAADDAKNKILIEAFGPDWNKKRLHKPEPEPINLPSVLEFLGPDWKKYFLKPETIKEIIRHVRRQDEMQNDLRNYLSRERAGTVDDGIAYDSVEISSVTQLGCDRQRVIAQFRDIKSGLIKKWSLDITSTAPLWDQIFYALYDSGADCTRNIILYFEDLTDRYESGPEIDVDKDAMAVVFYSIFSFTDRVYPIHVQTTSHEKDNIKIYFFNYPISTGADGREKIPSRSLFENSIWEIYYSSFMHSSAIKEQYRSKLITDTDTPYAKIPFYVWPEWTEKGLLMRLSAESDCPETNWLITDKKAELAGRYPGREIEVKMKPYTHYCIDIQLHNAPVSDFAESPTRAKFNYASEIREQQLDLMRHIEEIFQDYALEAE